MILLFILYNLFMNSSSILASPPPLLHPTTIEIPSYLREIDPSKFTQRSIWNIVWGCLTTIFACSWISVHPNIPAPSGSIFLTRLKIMGCMLIMPEGVIIWAARQWYAAREIAERHKDRKWTKTHGFFAVMGGFMLYDNGVPTQILVIEELERLESEEKIDWPSILAKDIEDKSKGDFVSKGFAVLQTAWFIVQCIARAVVRLNLTELELVTLAFAVLNLILYTLWWDKPLAVGRPIPVHLRHPTISTTSSEPPSSPSSKRSSAVACSPAHLFRKLKDLGWFALLYLFTAFRIFGSSIVDMFCCDALPDSTQLSVPTFYAPGSVETRGSATGIGFLISMLFGGIHCIAWSFVFPSVREEYVWKISAVTITAVPVIVLLQSVIYCMIDIPSERTNISALDIFILMDAWFLIVGYCISRIALFVLPLLALRSLPSESLLDIKWTSYIPHI